MIAYNLNLSSMAWRLSLRLSGSEEVIFNILNSLLWSRGVTLDWQRALKEQAMFPAFVHKKVC